MDKVTQQILQMRMHGLYLSRRCDDITQLSRDMLGLHCWFHRNVAFSALIRGADLMGWKTALAKTWLYRGTLHGVAYDDLPTLLALHPGETYLENWLDKGQIEEIAEKVIYLMEDGVYSRAEMRRIFAHEYDSRVIDAAFSPWGGIFVYLARLGKVTFRNMTSRDFDLISAEPTETADEVLPRLFRRFIAAYGPATIADASWFFGFFKEGHKRLAALDLSEYLQLEHNRSTYYYLPCSGDMDDIPQLTLLAGFDPLIVSYADRSAVLPAQYKSAVILKSGICNPTIAINGQVAGIWNIKKGQPVVTFFEPQSKRLQEDALDLVYDMCRRTAGMM